MDRYDLLLVAGVLLVVVGIGMVAIPAALVAGGFALILYGAAADLRANRRRIITEKTDGTPR